MEYKRGTPESADGADRRSQCSAAGREPIVSARPITEDIEQLRGQVKPGDTLWTALRHVSASGMSRTISVVVISVQGGSRDLSQLTARALGYRWDDHRGGMMLPGVGMDMGFWLIYALSQLLWPDYPCLGQQCGSPDHANPPYISRGLSTAQPPRRLRAQAKLVVIAQLGDFAHSGSRDGGG